MHSAAVATFAQASHRGKPQKQCMRKIGFEAESLDRERTSEEKMSLVVVFFWIRCVECKQTNGIVAPHLNSLCGSLLLQLPLSGCLPALFPTFKF